MARRERKVITALFADLVGFTARAESLDPEDVEAILRPYHAHLRSELERHGGTVEKFIGDAVMSLFGAPVAHEDDPERAVRAALAIRDWAREEGELEVRIGITTGEALVSLDARPEAGEGMAAGDVVNTAARLQSSAPVNAILVDETTYRATRERIEYADTEPVVAKGKTEPVTVWEVGQARARFGADVVQVGATLVGRRRELDLLSDALARAREERSTQLVTLVGVPGIGKSRLVYELYRRVEAEEEMTNWRQGRSLPYGEGVTYWALAEMAKAQAGILESDGPEEAERKLEEVAGALARDAEQVLEGLRPLVGLGGDGEAGADRSERFAAWRAFFESLAEHRPTVLVFEDLHWADDDLLDFVDHLVDWASGVPLLVVCTARPELLERRPGWGGGKPNAHTLSISPLSDDDTARLLGALLERSVLPAETQESLLARAGGNPLYAEQFARLLAESGGEEQPLPENVQGIIAARLDGLPPDEKRLLHDAAVLGKVFWNGAVCAVGSLERSEAEERLHALERKEFVRRERRSSVGGEDEYAFRHVLVRDVAYGQIPRSSRAERHERAAEWIDALGRPDDHAEMLAHHYLVALELLRAAGEEEPPGLVERGRRAARDAGDRALVLGSYAAATRFYDAALELWPVDDDARAELLLAYARARVDDASLDDTLLTEAVDALLRVGKIEDAAEAEARLGDVWLNRGDRDRALEHLERARELVSDRGPSRAKTFVLQELGRVLMMGDDERAIEVARESLQLAEALGFEAARSRNLNTIGVMKVMTGDRSGLQDLEQAVAIGAAARSHEEVGALANLQTMMTVLGDLRRADEVQEQSLEVARRQGLVSFVRWQEAERALFWYWAGRWPEAFARVNELIAASEATSPHYMDSVSLCVRGTILLARGEVDAAVRNARRATDLARVTQHSQTLNPAIAFQARAECAAANMKAADEAADELLAAWSSDGMVRGQLESVDGAWVLTELGRTDELIAAIDRAPSQTLWNEGARRIASGDFVGAADAYAEIGSVPDEAYARLRAAEQLVSTGHRAEADSQLGIALPVFAELGATAWRAEAESLLAASA
jgi:class 3 adenylate cyclase/tetratricopeptide (TPR) repeat protein